MLGQCSPGVTVPGGLFDGTRRPVIKVHDAGCLSRLDEAFAGSSW